MQKNGFAKTSRPTQAHTGSNPLESPTEPLSTSSAALLEEGELTDEEREVFGEIESEPAASPQPGTQPGSQSGSQTGTRPGTQPGDQAQVPGFNGQVSFVGDNAGQRDLASQAMNDQRRHRLNMSKFGGMAQRLEELAAANDGRNRLDLLLAGLAEPESDAERQFLEMAKTMTGAGEVLMPDFLSVDEGGGLIVHCDQMRNSGSIGEALNLLPALQEAGGKLLPPAKRAQIATGTMLLPGAREAAEV